MKLICEFMNAAAVLLSLAEQVLVQSVVACILNNLTQHNVKVNLLGGAVNIEWSGTKENPNKDIFLLALLNTVLRRTTCL